MTDSYLRGEASYFALVPGQPGEVWTPLGAEVTATVEELLASSTRSLLAVRFSLVTSDERRSEREVSTGLDPEEVGALELDGDKPRCVWSRAADT